MERKTLWFVRGVSGAGKSTVASKLKTYLPDADSVEADDFRYVNGEYVYDEKGNFHAHQGCFNQTKALLDTGLHNVVVSNTSTRRRDVKKYRDLAVSCGYNFISIVVENYHETGNVHGVQEEVLCKMEAQLLRSLKLK